MALNAIRCHLRYYGGILHRLHLNPYPRHSDPCTRHCGPYGAAHSGASYPDPISAHVHHSSNVSADSNRARRDAYAGPP